MRSRSIVFLLLALYPCAPARSQQQPPRVPAKEGTAARDAEVHVSTAQVAEQFLAAFRKQDAAAMQKVIDQAPPERLDFVRVADELLRMHGQAKLALGEGDFLTAAAALAEATRERRQEEGLSDLVASWRTYGAEELAAEIAVRDLQRRIQEALRQRDLAAALQLADRAEACLEKAPRSCAAVSLQFAVGLAHVIAGEFDASSQELRAAAGAAAAIRWHCASAEILATLGEQARNTGDFTGAFATGQQELLVRESCGHERRSAKLLMELGDICCRGGTLSRAQPHYERARERFAQLGDQEGVAQALWALGALEQLSLRPKEACAFLEQSLALFEALGNERRATRTRGTLGLALCESGEDGRGQPLLEQAEHEAAALGDHRLLGEILDHRGDAWHQTLQYALARAAYERARTEHLAIGHASAAACSLANIGMCFMQEGRYAEALATNEEAVRELVGSGRRLNAAESLVLQSHFHLRVRDHPAAVAASERAIAILDALGETRVLGGACFNLGTACYYLKDYGRAAEAYQRALAVFEEHGETREVVKSRAALGRCQLFLDEKLALETLAQVREHATASGDPLTEALALRSIGIGHLGRREFAPAAETHELAVAQMRELGDRQILADALGGLAWCRYKLGDASAALRAAREAVSIWTALGRDHAAETDALLISDFGGETVFMGIEAAALSARLPSEAGEHALEEALWFVESGRGQLLLSGLVNRDAMMTANVDPELCAARTTARNCLRAAQQELLQLFAGTEVTPQRVLSTKQQLDVAYLAFEAAIARTQREAARVAAVVHPEPVSLAALREQLLPDELLVQYVASKYDTLVVAVGKDSGQILNLGDSGELAQKIGAWLELLAVDGSSDEAMAAGLYDALLRPLEGVLANKRRLLLSPDGVLTFLPVEALLRTGDGKKRRVLELYELAYVPSATVLATLRAEAQSTARGTGLLALGDPVYPGEGASTGSAVATRDAEERGLGGLGRLPGTGDEVRAIRDLFPAEHATVLLREHASVNGLEHALAQKPGRLAAVHFACHGHVDLERPRLTGLVLAHGEVLTLDSLYQRRIPADLAVLSACETAKGKIYRGEGVVGTVRGFFFAGCPRVVVSNWKVSDQSTRALMVDFYRQQLVEGLPPAAALHAAKLARLRAGGRTAHPYHWAAFVCWGLPD